jgi:hypothetical protein
MITFCEAEKVTEPLPALSDIALEGFSNVAISDVCPKAEIEKRKKQIRRGFSMTTDISQQK